jgi:hypothetical protein
MHEPSAYVTSVSSAAALARASATFTTMFKIALLPLPEDTQEKRLAYGFA